MAARQEAIGILDEVLEHLQRGRRSRASARSTQRNFDGPIQTIIPWAGNQYTETLIEAVRARNGRAISGASGCSAACRAAAWAFSSTRGARPRRRSACRHIMSETKRRLEHAVPFAMEPGGLRFRHQRARHHGRAARWRRRAHAGGVLHADRAAAGAHRSSPALRCAARGAGSLQRRVPRQRAEFAGMVQQLFDHLLPRSRRTAADGCTDAGSAARSSTDSTARSTSRFRPTCAAGASAWRRTGCRQARDIEDVQAGDVADAVHGLADSGIASSARTRWRTARWRW